MKLNDRLSFGEHVGRTVQEVISDDIAYLAEYYIKANGIELDEQSEQVFNDALESYLEFG